MMSRSKRGIAYLYVAALCHVAAACDGGRSDREGAAPGNEMANARQGPRNEAEPSRPQTTEDHGRSILRPEIVPAQPPAPQPEPAHATVPFGSSGLELDDNGRAAIDALLSRPVVLLGGPITLRGHTDSRGADGDNLVVARIRAESVRDYLLSKGVAEDRIAIISLGETRPIAPNAREDGSDDPDGRARNRRVEIDIGLPAARAGRADTPAMDR